MNEANPRNRNDIHTPTSNINHTHAQTIVLSQKLNHRCQMDTLTMSRDAGKHDVKLRAIGVVDLAKKFIVCNVPCKEISCEAVTIRIVLTNNKENTAKTHQNNDR